MRVVITKFPHNSLLGGGELHTLTLVKSLSKKGFDFVLLSSDDILIEEFKKRSFSFKKMWSPLEPVSLRGLILFPILAPFFFWYLLFEVLRAKTKDSALFCLSYTEKILFTPIAYLLGMKVIWMEHLRIERSYFKNPLRPFYVFFSRMATVVTVSHSVGAQLVELGVKKERVQVIYNGIDTEKFAPANKSTNATINIGAMSRIVDEKGLDVLIKAFSIISKKHQARLLIAGEGPAKKGLIDLVAEQGLEEDIAFVGFVNPVEFLRDIDIFALTPRAKESFGYVAAEAMALEIPVVATSLSGLAEVVEDGKTGFLCEVGAVNCIAAKIERLIIDSSMRTTFGKEGRKRVETRFSYQGMISSFESLFKEQ